VLPAQGNTISLAGLDVHGLLIASLRSGQKTLATTSFVRP